MRMVLAPYSRSGLMWMLLATLVPQWALEAHWAQSVRSVQAMNTRIGVEELLGGARCPAVLLGSRVWKTSSEIVPLYVGVL